MNKNYFGFLIFFVVFIWIAKAQTDVPLKKIVFDESTPLLKPLNPKHAAKHFESKKGHSNVPIFVLSHSGGKLINHTVKVQFLNGPADPGQEENAKNEQKYATPMHIHGEHKQGEHNTHQQGVQDHDQSQPETEKGHRLNIGDVQHEHFAQGVQPEDHEQQGAEDDHMINQGHNEFEHGQLGFDSSDGEQGLESNLLNEFEHNLDDHSHNFYGHDHHHGWD